MKNKKQLKQPPAPRNETATPFFARYLEGQDAEPDAEARVSGGRRKAEVRTGAGGAKKAAKKSAAKKSGAKKAAKIPLQTLKYPSDRDEYILIPYKLEAVTATEGLRVTKKFPSDLDEDVTLKFPSDGDDDNAGYYAVYANKADVPKSAAAKPREAKINLSKKAPKS